MVLKTNSPNVLNRKKKKESVSLLFILLVSFLFLPLNWTAHLNRAVHCYVELWSKPHLSAEILIHCMFQKSALSSPKELQQLLETLNLQLSHLQHLPHCNLKFKVPLLLHMGRPQNSYCSTTLSFQTSVSWLSTFFPTPPLMWLFLVTPFPSSRSETCSSTSVKIAGVEG